MSHCFGKWGVKQIYPSVKSKKWSQRRARGMLFEINYISIEHRRADPMTNSLPPTRYKLHFFLFPILPHLTSPEALPLKTMIVLWKRLLRFSRGPINITHAKPLLFFLKPPPPIPPRHNMQYVPGNFSVHYFIVFL